MIGPKYQRGYAVVPWLASLFTAGGAAGTGAAAGAAGAAAGGAAAGGAAAGAAAGGISAGAAAAAAATTAGVGLLGAKLLSPSLPKLQGDAPPTIDRAKQAQQTTDRLKLRRGVLANVYGGGVGGTPSVGVKTLLGQ